MPPDAPAAPGAPEWWEGPAAAVPPPLPPGPAGYGGWDAQPPAPPYPYAHPPEGNGARPWRTPLLVGVAAAVVAGSAVAAWMLLGTEDAPPADARPPAAPAPAREPTPRPTDPAAPGTPSATASPSPSAGTGDGYTVVSDGSGGFSVAVPDGWQPSRDETGSGSFYRPPGDRSALLQIFRVGEDPGTGSCELLRLSSQRLDDGTPAYRQISLEPVAGGACELVYEYDSAESHGRRQGVERIVSTPDGGRWALLAAGPAADAATTRAHLTAALDSFRPR
ncbi:hypothetical protein [Streptomyces sp. NPDC029003]|uniref:hypothetical protein n=1 Tax=Streptomyces sp. NPDC029003 TaxID=3155125 RepID=UPI0033C44FBD